jgi:hypothetical protein
LTRSKKVGRIALEHLFYGVDTVVFLKFFELLSIFDWVTPTFAMLEDIAEGGPLNLDAWTFYIPYEKAVSKSWCAVDIEKLLGYCGVKTWGGLIRFGVFFFSVKLEQAAWAEYILTRYGVPVYERSLGAPHPKGERRQSPQKKQQHSSRGPLSFLDDFCDECFSSPFS